MNPQIDTADTRITDLQARLDDVNRLLVEALGLGKWRDPAVRTNLKMAIRAITALSADIACVCQREIGRPLDPGERHDH